MITVWLAALQQLGAVCCSTHPNWIVLFCLCTAAAFCELSLKIIFPQCTVGICHFPSSQLGQSKSKLQFENHRGNSVILLTCIILNLIRQVRWPYVYGDFSASRASSCRTEAIHKEVGGRLGVPLQRSWRNITKPFKCQAKLDLGKNRARNPPRHPAVILNLFFYLYLWWFW